MEKKSFWSLDKLVFLAAGLGLVSGYSHNQFVVKFAHGLSQVFINLLQLISLPIIFLSIVATVANMQSISEMKVLGRKIVTYTFLTTLIAASVALLLFRWINPLQGVVLDPDVSGTLAGSQASYLNFILDIIPSNAIQALGNNNQVMSVVFIAVMLGVAILSLSDQEKAPLQKFFKSLFAAVLKLTTFIMYVMPLGVWAFMTLFMKDFSGNSMDIKTIWWYVFCVLLANVVQGLIVLPGFLWLKGISPQKTFVGMFPALLTAFFSKSSNVALPFSMNCAQKKFKSISKSKFCSFSTVCNY